jgi:hypothetical protein
MCASVDSSGALGNGNSRQPAISADGVVVSFWSSASNLVSGDINGVDDVFVHDLGSGATELVSVDSTGNQGNSTSHDPSISADGRFVAFWSYDSNLVSGDTNSSPDVFARDLAFGTTTRASVDSSGNEGNSSSFDPALSGDGQVIGFHSIASNLVTSDTNGTWDVFVHEPCNASWINYGAGYTGTLGIPSLTAGAPPVIGTSITFDIGNSLGKSTGALLFAGDTAIDVPTSAGGDLLVVPTITAFLPLPAGGLSVPVSIPNTTLLCGFVYCVQVLEADSGAAHRISFSRGMELIFGM